MRDLGPREYEQAELTQQEEATFNFLALACQGKPAKGPMSHAEKRRLCLRVVAFLILGAGVAATVVQVLLAAGLLLLSGITLFIASYWEPER